MTPIEELVAEYKEIAEICRILADILNDALKEV